MDFADNYDNEMTYRHKVNGVPTTHSNLSGLLDFFMKVRQHMKFFTCLGNV